MTQDRDHALPRVLWTEHFAGGGQGTFRFEVAEVHGQFQLTVRNEYLLNQEWSLPMRNAAECDITLAIENFKTLMWRCGLWYLKALVEFINLKLEAHPVQLKRGPSWLRYSLHLVKESPFDDPELNSPVAVIDRHQSRVLYPDRPKPRTLEWQQEPWAAVFLHDGTLLSCLPETDESYHPLRDVMELVMPFCQGLYVDQADFLGAVHAAYRLQPAAFDYDFLSTWGLN